MTKSRSSALFSMGVIARGIVLLLIFLVLSALVTSTSNIALAEDPALPSAVPPSSSSPLFDSPSDVNDVATSGARLSRALPEELRARLQYYLNCFAEKTKIIEQGNSYGGEDVKAADKKLAAAEGDLRRTIEGAGGEDLKQRLNGYMRNLAGRERAQRIGDSGDLNFHRSELKKNVGDIRRAVANHGSGPKGGSGKGSGLGVVTAAVTVANLGLNAYRISQKPENKGKSVGVVAGNEVRETVEDRGGGVLGAVFAAFDFMAMNTVGFDPNKVVKDGVVAGTVPQALPSLGVVGQVADAVIPKSWLEDERQTVQRESAAAAPSEKDLSSTLGGSEKEVGAGLVAPPAPGVSVPSDPAPSGKEAGGDAAPSAPSVPSSGGVANGSGGGLGDLGGEGVGSRGVGGGSEGGYQGSDSGKEKQNFKAAYEESSGSGSGGSTEGNLQIQENSSEDQEDSGSGKDDDKGGLINPFDDSVGGVGGDRANVLLSQQGLVSAVVSDLVALISNERDLDAFDLVADWGVGGEGPKGPEGGFLAALESLFGAALESKDGGSQGVLGLVDLVADWGDVDGDRGPFGSGGDGPGPGGLVANNEGDGTDGSKPIVDPRGGSRDSGQRVTSSRITVGSRTVQTDRTVSTTTRQQTTAVQAPTAPQSGKLAAPQTPTAITNNGPATETDSPATKLTSPGNTTSKVQNPTSQLSYSE